MRATASAIFALLAVACVGACKKSDGHVPRDLADDIDAIESALNESDRELANEGVVVAYRSTPGAFAEPGGAEATPTTPPPEPDTDGETLSPELPPDPAPDEPTTDMGDDAPMLHSPAPAEEPRGMTARDSESIEREKSPRRSRGRRVKAAKGPPTPCERICGLAESTCDLRDKICRMAERHFGDIRYATSCQRAEDQCEAVRSRCDSCAA